METSFQADLEFSKLNAPYDMAAIKVLIPGCFDVEVAPAYLDKKGADFIARLGDGSQRFIDVKASKLGAQRGWKDGVPRMVLERWSRMPTDERAGQVGWTLDEAKNTNLILVTYAPADCGRCWLFPARELRLAFAEHQHDWAMDYGPWKHVSTDGLYRTEFLCIPIPVVTAALASVASCVYPGSAVNVAGGTE